MKLVVALDVMGQDSGGYLYLCIYLLYKYLLLVMYIILLVIYHIICNPGCDADLSYETILLMVSR